MTLTEEFEQLLAHIDAGGESIVPRWVVAAQLEDLREQDRRLASLMRWLDDDVHG